MQNQELNMSTVVYTVFQKSKPGNQSVFNRVIIETHKYITLTYEMKWRQYAAMLE